MEPLLERDGDLAVLDDVLTTTLEGEGRLVAVVGEAGIGKSALVRRFAAANADRARFLVTACDDLLSPRPLGPLHDLVRVLGSPMAELMREDGSPARAFPAFAAELAGRLRPAVLVVEDLHWADGATLDWLAYLARRLREVPVMLLLTCRDDERDAVSELRRVLASAPRTHVARIEVAPLSSAAAATLVDDAEQVAEIMRLSSGNALLLTELAAAGAGGPLPETINDTVLMRMERLSEAAREVVEIAAVVPGRCAWSLLQATTPAWSEGSEDALSSGLVTDDHDGLVFRHEIVRHVVEAAMSEPRRRVVHGRVLTALEQATDADATRLAHHARHAGHAERVLGYATSAARAAAAAGAHRQALEQYRAALDHADGLADEARAELLGAFAQEARICNQVHDAIEALQAARLLWDRTDRTDQAPECLAVIARLEWWAGRREAAEEAARQAIAELEPLGASATLATAYGILADISMAVGEHEDAARRGEQALHLAEELGDTRALAAALSDTGSGAIFVDTDRGESLLRDAFTLADARGHTEIAGRAASTLALGCLYHRRYATAAERLRTALDYARAHELPANEALLLGLWSRWHLDQGRWADAERDARAMLGAGDQPGVSLCPALVTLGLLAARRGDADATEVLDDAWERALHTGDLQRIAPTAAARAEHAWLEDDLDGVVAAAQPAYELARQAGEPWSTGELGWWLCQAGRRPDIPDPVAEPFRLLCSGDWGAAAAAWQERGLPYERALALAESHEAEQLLEALTVVDGLGAAATARVLRRRLREQGVRSIPRGPRPTTRDNPAGLTARQQDVLELVAEGLTNRQIADRLVVSVRTVDHHVSAVLQKLQVATREAAAAWLAATDEGSPV
jgi:DNA-binding CsgD family transcriptional regulator/type II secretory pathway predicted ATPase ExeA